MRTTISRESRVSWFLESWLKLSINDKKSMAGNTRIANSIIDLLDQIWREIDATHRADPKFLSQVSDIVDRLARAGNLVATQLQEKIRQSHSQA